MRHRFVFIKVNCKFYIFIFGRRAIFNGNFAFRVYPTEFNVAPLDEAENNVEKFVSPVNLNKYDF